MSKLAKKRKRSGGMAHGHMVICSGQVIGFLVVRYVCSLPKKPGILLVVLPMYDAMIWSSSESMYGVSIVEGILIPLVKGGGGDGMAAFSCGEGYVLAVGVGVKVKGERCYSKIQ